MHIDKTLLLPRASAFFKLPVLFCIRSERLQSARSAYRRALQLVFAKRVKGDIENDSKTAGEAKPLSSNHDRNVAASYIEPKNNLRRDPGPPKTFTSHRYVDVAENEENRIAGWASWVDANTELEFDALLPLLLKKGSYAFPSRFPSEEPTEVARYFQFFDDVDCIEWEDM